MAPPQGPTADRPAPLALAEGAEPAAEPVEDRLEALLADPIVQLLMERDGVERDVLLRMADTVRRRALGSGECDARLPGGGNP